MTRRSVLAAAAVLALAACSDRVADLREARDAAGLGEVVADRDTADEDRVRAAEALGALGGPEAVEALAAVVAGPEGQYDPVPPAAAAALGRIGGPEAAAAIRTALDAETLKVEDAAHRDLRLLRALLVALGRAGGEGDVGRFVETASDPPSDEPAAAEAGAEALARLGPPAVPSLIEVLDEGRPAERAVAARALGDIGGPGVRPPLEQALDDEEAAREASLALARLAGGHRDLTPLLRRQATVRAYYGVIALGDERSEDDLLTALTRFADQEMARAYLASGNEALADPVREAFPVPAVEIPDPLAVEWGSVG